MRRNLGLASLYHHGEQVWTGDLSLSYVYQAVAGAGLSLPPFPSCFQPSFHIETGEISHRSHCDRVTQFHYL